MQVWRTVSRLGVVSKLTSDIQISDPKANLEWLIPEIPTTQRWGYNDRLKETIINLLWIVSSGWATYRLLLHQREPGLTLAWLIFVISVPIIGPCIFFAFGPLRLEKRARRRTAEILELSPVTEAAIAAAATSPQLSRQDTPILRLAEQVSDYPATVNNGIELLLDPQAALERMEDAINTSNTFVHLEYYIISNDEVAAQLLKALEKAAARGVEVRILYDALGSLFFKRIQFRELISAGGQVAGFLPLSAAPQRMNFNFRNHRKLLLVDGKVAFTGGSNIGREYLGRSNPSQWRDYSVAVTGPSCLQLEEVFSRDWQFTTGEDLSAPRYYPAQKATGSSLVQVLESGPDSAFHSLHQAILLMVNSAQNEIQLMTPYFIPDAALSSSLVSAALRGIKTTLLLPRQTDSPLVGWASRSFYSELLEAGVRIFEYLPKILHAKLLTVDDRWALLGSANMDTRSFKLNFELNLAIHGTEFTRHARTFFSEELLNCEEIALSRFTQRPTRTKLLENACRLLSPIL